MTEAAPEPSEGYSKAFETFVGDEGDLVGLIAYALYKKGIRQAAGAGRPALTTEHRTPSDEERKAFRSLAVEMLDTFGESAQASARNDILDGGFRPELDKLRAGLAAHIDLRTSWRSAFVVNLAAWLASIGITVLFALGVSVPSWAPRLRTILGL